MSPTPEPDHSGNLSDEEMPQQPPIFLSSSSDEEQEEPNPDYPAGYMPIGHHIEVQWASDTEEEDWDAASAPVQAPVLPSPSEAEEEEIDYSSLAGLMGALQAHGPTVVTDTHGLEDVYANEESPPLDVNRIASSRVASLAMAAAVPSAFNSEPLPKEQEDAILSAMKGFSLPASAIPPWAAQVPDDRLTSIIRNKLSGNAESRNCDSSLNS
ncbi:male-enhanced antigen 1 [Hyalella azteca]|uniref:Male-enhanced antigen 1 n=1 Tax=Hyalella azteca TaxID=294128 RepID=A0A8B7NQV2_HYAAZ|nr:male-enhanced antigen 1 [Hyalella azteca]